MKAITKEILIQILEKNQCWHRMLASELIDDDLFEEIDTLTVSRLRPMADAPGDINILVEHSFSNVMTESRAIPNEEIITSGGYVINYSDCEGWIPAPIYKPEKE